MKKIKNSPKGASRSHVNMPYHRHTPHSLLEKFQVQVILDALALGSEELFYKSALECPTPSCLEIPCESYSVLSGLF